MKLINKYIEAGKFHIAWLREEEQPAILLDEFVRYMHLKEEPKNWRETDKWFAPFADDATEDELKAALEIEPLLLYYVEEQTAELVEFAVKQNVEALVFANMNLITVRLMRRAALNYNSYLNDLLDLGLLVRFDADLDFLYIREHINKSRYTNINLSNSEIMRYVDGLTDEFLLELPPADRKIYADGITNYKKALKITNEDNLVEIIKLVKGYVGHLTKEQLNRPDVRKFIFEELHESIHLYDDITFDEAVNGAVHSRSILFSALEKKTFTTEQIRTLLIVQVLNGHDFEPGRFLQLVEHLDNETVTFLLANYSNPEVIYVQLQNHGWTFTPYQEYTLMRRGPQNLALIPEFDEGFAALYLKAEKVDLVNEDFRALVPARLKPFTGHKNNQIGLPQIKEAYFSMYGI